VVKNDGAYSSASDFDEDILALFAADNAGNEGTPEEHIDAGDTEHYEGLIVQRVLSAQMEKAEQNQRHAIPNQVCH
jgi:hypothetical protein